MKIKILWPDGPRMVTEEWLINMASDSWSDTAEADRQSTPCPATLDEAMNWLMDTGEVTFAADGGYAQEDPGDGGDFDYEDSGDYGAVEDSMDGDHESALESAGWGTDEDYGGYDDVE